MLKQKNEKLKENVFSPQQNININCFYYEADPNLHGFLFPLHWHDNLELTYVIEGSATIECEKTSFTVNAGEFCLISPSQYHSCDDSSADLKLYCLIVDMEVLTSKYLDFINDKYIKSVTDGLVTFKNHITDSTVLRDIVLSVYQKYTDKTLGYELEIKSELFKMLAHLFQTQIDTVISQEQSKTLSINKSRVNTILSYIDEHYMNPIVIDDLSKYICINKYYLCRFFSNITGKTIVDYINSFRIQKAIEFLMTTNMNVTEIASTVGFSDINYFSRIFKKYRKMSPTAVRKLHFEK